MKTVINVFAGIGLVSSLSSFAAENAAASNAVEIGVIEEVLVTGGSEEIITLSGSAQILEKETLEQFDSSDLNQVMATLPGVYIRQEDSFGLRPNIGIRGATSERSQKITIMEDGVLITPAPYSAPAAYYIPNISRMDAVEVLKGPSALYHGPHTVGGAINFATRPITDAAETVIDATYGSFNYQKYQLATSATLGQFGYSLDALNYSSDGFKDLDGGGDTGFERNDVNVKFSWQPKMGGEQAQLFTLKLGYADEDSNETYLGLTEEDFKDDPYRRYSASQLDHFTSEHYQVHLGHVINLSYDLMVTSKLYWNKFERSWNKLDGFIDSVELRTILDRPDAFTRQYDLITGAVDSNGNAAETFDVTNNDREYGSHGVQTTINYFLELGEIFHDLQLGIRFHHDYVDRNHKQQGYLMVNSNLVDDGQSYGSKTINQAETDALSLYLVDVIEWQDWKFTAGVRLENIDGKTEDELNQTRNTKSQSVTLPGLGVYYQYTESLGLLAGVYRGFSPAAPSANDSVDPELSTNYEYGLRYIKQAFSLEAIGFFSDYDNLLARCRASETTCEPGEEFNGDNVEIAGLELTGQWIARSEHTLQIPILLNYTFTESQFKTSFDSTFSQWGNVEEGDELPYLPKHIGRVQIGARTQAWEAYLAVSYQDEMRDEAGNEPISDVAHTDAYTVVDISGTWHVDPALDLQLSVDNVFDEAAIVSLRPYGARPNKPRSLRLRAKYHF